MRFSIFYLLGSITLIIPCIPMWTHLYYSALLELFRALLSVTRSSCPAAQAQAAEIDFRDHPCEERPERWHTATHDTDVYFEDAESLALAL